MHASVMRGRFYITASVSSSNPGSSTGSWGPCAGAGVGGLVNVTRVLITTGSTVTLTFHILFSYHQSSCTFLSCYISNYGLPPLLVHRHQIRPPLYSSLELVWRLLPEVFTKHMILCAHLSHVFTE